MMLLQSLTDMLVPVVPGVRNGILGIEMLQPDLVHECVQLPVAVKQLVVHATGEALDVG